MPSVAYFRRQADICFRLALIASDEEVSNRLIIMAQEYTAKGNALAKQAGADASSTVDPGALTDMAGGEPGPHFPPPPPHSSADFLDDRGRPRPPRTRSPPRRRRRGPTPRTA